MSIRRAARTVPALGVVLLWAFSIAGHAANDSASDREVDNLVDQIIELRADVEDLDSKLQSLKKEHESRMSSLARQEGELTSRRESQKLQVDKLNKKLADLREQLKSAGVANDEIAPVLHDAIAGMRDYVRGGLPFKRGERLASLDKLETQLDNGALEPPRVANRLWSFYADEIRLTGENGVYRQPVDIQGEERLVDVARLGMMMLYFRTDDERYGYATRNEAGWRFQYVGDREARGHIDTLFDSLHKQIRTGYFQLPNSLDLPAAGGAN